MHLAGMSKLQPERRLGCCTLHLDFPRRSGTYSDLIFNGTVVQSTLLHFSSESGPSGKFRHFQILRVHDALLQVFGNNCLGKSWHQNSSIQDDIQASMWYSDVSSLLSEGCQLFEKCISQKCQSCSLRGAWAVAPCSLTSQGDLGHTPT